MPARGGGEFCGGGVACSLRFPCDLVVIPLLITDSSLAGANDFLRSATVAGAKDVGGRTSVIRSGVDVLFSGDGRREDDEREKVVDIARNRMHTK